MTTKARYTNGTIAPLTYDKIKAFKAKLKDGDFVELGFRRWRESRTDRQNRYLHALIQRYRSAMGYSMTAAKNELCIEFGIAIKIANWEDFDTPEWYGIFCEYHDVTYFRKSTTVYTTKEMKELIDGIKLAMTDNGIDYQDIEPEE